MEFALPVQHSVLNAMNKAASDALKSLFFKIETKFASIHAIQASLSLAPSALNVISNVLLVRTNLQNVKAAKNLCSWFNPLTNACPPVLLDSSSIKTNASHVLIIA